MVHCALIPSRVKLTAVITFDLQQNLPVPTLTHGSMFYLRQLWVYNFGIHDCSKDTAVMCMWNETIAGRGASEIISCLMQYISKLPPSVKALTCYSDSCFGQNKNSLFGLTLLFGRGFHALIINIWFVGILTSPTTETSPRSRRGKPVLRSISLRIGRGSCASPVPLNHFTFRK